MKKLIKKILVKTELKLITGLHIGGNKENVEIGGIDNPVLRAAMKDNQPYIPGSSLKGKMRCLLEQIEGKDLGESNTVNFLFGFAKKDDSSSSRVIFRDAYLTEKSKKALENSDNLDMPFTEGKWENVINRVKGTAENPRQTERIPAGVSFVVEFVINVWDIDKDGDKSLALLKKGIEALENDYLGGSGTRGYGQVEFSELKISEIDLTGYFSE